MPRFIISSATAKQQVFELPKGEYVIGRDPAAQIQLPNVSVSREHAKVVVSEGGATLEDMGSGNGTTVNGNVVLQHHLQSKDEVRVGKFSLVFLTDVRADEFYKGRCVRYMPHYEARGAEVGQDETFVLTKDALRAMASQSRLVEHARIVLIRDPSRFWHPEERPMSFGGAEALIHVAGWFIFGTVAEITWDGARHILRKNAWWVPVKVNEVAVDKAHLKHNDRLTIGEARFRYEGEK